MSLPKPNYAFNIPSVHDDLELDCRLYYPRRTEQNSEIFGKVFAIFAHPYATLGGSYDDPVVGLAGAVLLRYGCSLITFNFRGASGSAGRTSWTGKPELGDYVSVYGFALCYINAIHHRQEVSTATPGCSKAVLIIGGYSYGSMIASHLPSRDQVLELFKAPASDSAESEIKLRAEDLSRDAIAYLEMHTPSTSLSVSRVRANKADDCRHSHRAVAMGGYESDVASRRVSRESSRMSLDGERVRQSIDNVRRKISHHRVTSPRKTELKLPPQEGDAPIVPRIAYIILSPLLPPIAGFTTMFSKLHFVGRNSGSNKAAASSSVEFEELTTNPCICIYGSKDAFTSDRRLQRWTECLSSRPDSQFVAIRTGSGHFWQDSDGIVRMQRGLADWLRGVVPLAETGKTGKTEDMVQTTHRHNDSGETQQIQVVVDG